MRVLKITAILAIIAMAAAAPVFAQTSPTYQATAGVFTTDVEDSMDVHYYGDVQFEKFAAFITAERISNATSAIGPSLGYAFKPGGLYLGLFYNGNAVSFTNLSQADSVRNTYSLTDEILTETQTITQYTGQDINSNNRIEALIGVAGMGIKVGFYERLTTRNNPNITSTTTENFLGSEVTYRNDVTGYSYANGFMSPSLQWGMTLAAGNLKLRPTAGVNFNINLDNENQDRKGVASVLDTTYTMSHGTLVGVDRKSTTGRNNDYLNPYIYVGADADITEKSTIGINYGITLGIYDKDYSLYGFKGSVKGGYSILNAERRIETTPALTTTTNNVGLFITDRESMSHRIVPSFRHENEIGGVKFGFIAYVPVTISTSSVTGSGIGTDGYFKSNTTIERVFSHASETDRNRTTITEINGQKQTTDTTTLQISPRLAIGAIYDLIPNRFSVKAGIGFNPASFTSTTTNVSGGGYATEKVTIKDEKGDVISVTERVGTVDSTGGFNPLAAPPGSTTIAITDRSTVSDTWTNFSATANAGFTFNFSENMFIDMAVNGGAGVFDFVLTLTSVEVLFGFKF